MKINNGFAIFTSIAIIAGVLVVGGVIYYWIKNPTHSLQNIALYDEPKTNDFGQKFNYQNQSDYIIALNQQDQKLILVDIGSKIIKPISGSFLPYSSTNYVHNYDFSFSPDKKSFLVIKNNNIFKIDTETLAEKQLTFQGANETKDFLGIQVSRPKWAPNGQHIYFSVEAIDNFSDVQKKLPKTQLGTWVMDDNGDQQKYLSKISFPLGNPVGWMINNTEIAFNDNFSAKIYDIGTEKIRDFSSKKIKDMSFSQSGKFGVYLAEDSMDSYLVDSNFNVIDSITRQNGQIPLNILTTDFVLEFWEARLISPNGKYVIVTKMTLPYEKGQQADTYVDNVELYLWEVETKEKIKLPIFVSQFTKVFWTSDSSKIIFTRPEKLKPGNSLVRPMDIYTYDIQSQKEERITNINNIDHTFIDY